MVFSTACRTAGKGKGGGEGVFNMRQTHLYSRAPYKNSVKKKEKKNEATFGNRTGVNSPKNHILRLACVHARKNEREGAQTRYKYSNVVSRPQQQRYAKNSPRNSKLLQRHSGMNVSSRKKQQRNKNKKKKNRDVF